MVLYFSGIEDQFGKKVADTLKVVLIAAILVLPFLAYAATQPGSDDSVKTALLVVAVALALVQAYAMFLKWKQVKEAPLTPPNT